MNQFDAKAQEAATAALKAVGTWAMTGNAQCCGQASSALSSGSSFAVTDFGHDVTLAFLQCHPVWDHRDRYGLVGLVRETPAQRYCEVQDGTGWHADHLAHNPEIIALRR